MKFYLDYFFLKFYLVYFYLEVLFSFIYFTFILKAISPNNKLSQMNLTGGIARSKEETLQKIIWTIKKMLQVYNKTQEKKGKKIMMYKGARKEKKLFRFYY